MPDCCARGCAHRSGWTSAAAAPSPSPSRWSERCTRCSRATPAGRSPRLPGDAPRADAGMNVDPGATALAELLPLIAILGTTGLIAGFAAGLLGVGGGIVTVPVLEYTLRFAGVPDEFRMHVAVATSLAAIIPTSISSARTHH